MTRKKSSSDALVKMDHFLDSGHEIIGEPILAFTSAIHGLSAHSKYERFAGKRDAISSATINYNNGTGKGGLGNGNGCNCGIGDGMGNGDPLYSVNNGSGKMAGFTGQDISHNLINSKGFGLGYAPGMGHGEGSDHGYWEIFHRYVWPNPAVEFVELELRDDKEC